MAVWLREVAGWILIGLGLAIFAVTYYVFLLNKLVVQAFVFGFIGWSLFRGGLHLLKVAIAARIARDAGIVEQAGHLPQHTQTGRPPRRSQQRDPASRPSRRSRI